MSRALALADALVAALPPGPARAFALLERSYLEDDHTETGVGLLREALDHVGDDRVLRARVLDQLGWTLAMFQGRLDAGLECAREALALVEPRRRSAAAAARHGHARLPGRHSAARRGPT